MSPALAHRLFQQEVSVLQAEGRTGNATQDEYSQFFGLPHDDYIRALRLLRDEIEERAYLAIVAATEGVLQLDFRARGGGKANVRLRNAAKGLVMREKKGRRIELEEILDAWLKEPDVPNDAIAEFKQLMAHRHWLAHCRYFVDRAGVTADPHFAFNRASNLLGQLGAVDASFPRRFRQSASVA